MGRVKGGEDGSGRIAPNGDMEREAVGELVKTQNE